MESALLVIWNFAKLKVIWCWVMYSDFSEINKNYLVQIRIFRFYWFTSRFVRYNNICPINRTLWM